MALTKYGEIPIGAIPAGEPVFIIRGIDAAGPAAVYAYMTQAAKVGASADFCAAVYDAAQAMQDWQNAHLDQVKVPD